MRARLEERSIIAKRYQVVRPLGEGASGSVYLCLDLLTRLKVAVKVLPYPHSRREAARVLRELRVGLRNDHPNVVRFYEFLHVGPLLAYAMEFVPGESLASLIDGGKLPHEDVAISILFQIACGLRDLHSSGLVHRDLKPANIVFAAESGLIKIVDLGLAARPPDRSGKRTMTASSHEAQLYGTTKGKCAGTPFYMAPETIESGVYDVRSDIYSFGIIAYELIIGSSPYKALEVVPLLAEKCERDIVVPDGKCTAQIRELITRCVSRAPQHRPSVTELTTVFSSLILKLPGRKHFGLSPTHNALRKKAQIMGRFVGSFAKIGDFLLATREYCAHSATFATQLNDEHAILQVLEDAGRKMGARPSSYFSYALLICAILMLGGFALPSSVRDALINYFRQRHAPNNGATIVERRPIVPLPALFGGPAATPTAIAGPKLRFFNPDESHSQIIRSLDEVRSDTAMPDDSTR